jgi:signal transduction histidine kinase
LVEKIEELLCQRCQSSTAAFLIDHGSSYSAGKLELAKNSPGHKFLCTLGWATPESLLRRRPSPGVDDLVRTLVRHDIAVAVTAPGGSQNPSLILVLGTRTTHRPFTYPEVQRLQNIAELIDNILSHARLAAQAALEAKMQHLALMSRGLAHDLKNLITPISAFLVHTDGRFPADTVEAEVHGDAMRSVRLMTDYVREALFFSSRLTPRFEACEVERVFAAVREAGAARANQHGVAIELEPRDSGEIVADAVLLQRLLGNLLHNAIDASPPGTTVRIRGTATTPGRVRFEVIDTGCGIPPETLGRIFDPYFTTKEFGSKQRGFGLGLTICEKIVDLHQGTILVRSAPGAGTTVTVELPAAPSAFAPTTPRPAPS